MEDEECLPENSPLKVYLQNLGFSDVQLTENIQSHSPIVDVSKQKSKWNFLEYIDEDIIYQIKILLTTQMLFEEDVSNIEKLLSNFKVVRNGMLKNMFHGSFGVAVVFVGLCLYWWIGNYAFLIVSTFYAYNAADYLRRRHFIQNRLKKLSSVLQTNFMVLRKVVRFIEENSKIVELSTNSNPAVDYDFEFYNSFKSDCEKSLNEMIVILIKSTQKLISKIPFYDYMENPKYYLCNNYNEICFDSVDVSKLYQIYLLVQSEFLQRLVLSLIPNIKVSPNNSFKELNKILTETCISLLKIKNKLNKKFKFIFLNGIHSPKTKIEFKSTPRVRTTNVSYVEEFVSNIHDTSNTFQNLLIKSRILEENIKSDKISQDIENDLVNIQNDLNTCQRNIADSFILLKKANSNCQIQEPVSIKEIREVGDDNIEKVEIGFPDLDPKIEDEIFEAYMNDEKIGGDLSNIDDWDFEDHLKKKLEKEYSKNVIRELKTKIVERAKIREKREAELLRKKGIIVEPEEDTSENVENKEQINNNPESISVEDIKTDFKKMFQNTDNKSCLEAQQKASDFEPGVFNDEFQRNNFRNDVINKNLLFENDRTYTADDFQQTCPGMVDKTFLSDLSQARQKILNISNETVEECFGDSSEEEQDEDQ